jgi:hypothetical protein
MAETPGPREARWERLNVSYPLHQLFYYNRSYKGNVRGRLGGEEWNQGNRYGAG